MVWTEGAPCAQMPRTTRGICTEEVLVPAEDVGFQLKRADEVFEAAARNVVLVPGEEEHSGG